MSKTQHNPEKKKSGQAKRHTRKNNRRNDFASYFSHVFFHPSGLASGGCSYYLLLYLLSPQVSGTKTASTDGYFVGFSGFPLHKSIYTRVQVDGTVTMHWFIYKYYITCLLGTVLCVL